MSRDGYDHQEAAAQADYWMNQQHAWESADPDAPRTSWSGVPSGSGGGDRVSREPDRRAPSRHTPATTASIFSVYWWPRHDPGLDRPLDDQEHRDNVLLFRRTKARLVRMVLLAVAAVLAVVVGAGFWIAAMPDGQEKHHAISAFVWVAGLVVVGSALAIGNAAGTKYRSPNTQFRHGPPDENR